VSLIEALMAHDDANRNDQYRMAGYLGSLVMPHLPRKKSTGVDPSNQKLHLFLIHKKFKLPD